MSLIFRINPIEDPRWDAFLQAHPRSCIFHSRSWLQALYRTYGYSPIVFTTAAPNAELSNGIPFCIVNSWITGTRLVSLPFSDHCALLVDSPAETGDLVRAAGRWMRTRRFRYAELRPLGFDREALGAFQPDAVAERYWMHTLSLDSPGDVIFHNTHKDCIQRKVRRAEKEGLEYAWGNSERLLGQFYTLLIRTRRRHCLPPQPYQWFRNLATSMGPQLTIHTAARGTRVIAAMITLSWKETLTYKYGCSDERFNALGGMPFLFWRVIQGAKAAGLRELDLGRSEEDNAGLIAFKDRLGAEKILLEYYRFSAAPTTGTRRLQTQPGFSKWFFQHMPAPLLVAAGKLLYRHMG